jgi:hypothetical protein
MPAGPPNIPVAAGSENIHFIGTPTTLTVTISCVGVVFIGSPALRRAGMGIWRVATRHMAVLEWLLVGPLDVLR